jgi:hypothetical protein
MRQCSSCGEHLPLEAFNRYRGGYQWWCRECFRAYFRARGDHHRHQSNAARRRRLAVGKRFIVEYLRSHPCVDCGESDLRVLDFDHVRPRREYVSRLLGNGATIQDLKSEIERCQVVCANCHRRRTARRKGWWRLTGGHGGPAARPRRERNVRWVYAQLAVSRCADCGVADPLVLEHDHLGEKRDAVMALAWTEHSLETLAREISMCEVRCCNCHRRKTADAGGWFRARANNLRWPP